MRLLTPEGQRGRGGLIGLSSQHLRLPNFFSLRSRFLLSFSFFRVYNSLSTYSDAQIEARARTSQIIFLRREREGTRVKLYQRRGNKAKGFSVVASPASIGIEKSLYACQRDCIGCLGTVGRSLLTKPRGSWLTPGLRPTDEARSFVATSLH